MEGAALFPDCEALLEALIKLEQDSPRAAEITRMRFVLDLSAQETADLLDISLSTVKREWSYARAFFLRELKHPVAELDASGEEPHDE